MQTLIEQCGNGKCKAARLTALKKKKRKSGTKSFDPPALQHSDKRYIPFMEKKRCLSKLHGGNCLTKSGKCYIVTSKKTKQTTR